MNLVEKCICGNDLVLEWNEDEKFKMVRCPNCNNEMKFKNPNLSSNKVSFEDAKEIATNKAKEVNKIIMEIKENEEYWFFEAGMPNESFFDDGAGSCYIRKQDGKVILMHLWEENVQKLNAEFRKNSKIIYNYYEEEKIKSKWMDNMTSDEWLVKIIEEVIGNNDPYWVVPIKKIVTKIIGMENGATSTIGELLGDDTPKFTSKQLFDIDKAVSDVCLKLKIKLDKNDFQSQIVGLPYNIPFKKTDARLKCPNCNEPLMFLMPDGTTLHCNKCNKYYINNNGSVGDETTSPYTRDDVLY